MPAVKSNKGFGIIEVLVAMFIFAVVLLGLLSAIVVVKDNNTRTLLRNKATELMNNEYEKQKSVGYEKIDQNCVDKDPCNPDSDSCSETIKIRNTDIIIGWSTAINEIKSNKLTEITTTTCWKYKGKSYQNSMTFLIRKEYGN
ncbi:MAG: hypothetical protein JG762_834 [Deferribacteraceae bacterium]|nr:hypothetical protein [Deferribacteraceae bacterium]